MMERSSSRSSRSMGLKVPVLVRKHLRQMQSPLVVGAMQSSRWTANLQTTQVYMASSLGWSSDGVGVIRIRTAHVVGFADRFRPPIALPDRLPAPLVKAVINHQVAVNHIKRAVLLPIIFTVVPLAVLAVHGTLLVLWLGV